VPVIRSYEHARQIAPLFKALMPDSLLVNPDELKRNSARLVALYPRDPRPRYNRANALVEAKDFDGAITQLRRALHEKEILADALFAPMEGVLKVALASALAERVRKSKESGLLDQALADCEEIMALDMHAVQVPSFLKPRMLAMVPFVMRGQVYQH